MDNDYCHPTTAGGNSTITNGDEAQPLKDLVKIPARIEGGQDEDFH